MTELFLPLPRDNFVLSRVSGEVEEYSEYWKSANRFIMTYRDVVDGSSGSLELIRP
jgi:hypothetical protein